MEVSAASANPPPIIIISSRALGLVALGRVHHQQVCHSPSFNCISYASNLNEVNDSGRWSATQKLTRISMQASDLRTLQAVLAATQLAQVVDSLVEVNLLPALVLEEQVRPECAESPRRIFEAFSLRVLGHCIPPRPSFNACLLFAYDFR